MMPEDTRILVVDDERFNVNILVDLLKPDYKMMAAKSGEQALKAAFSANPPDLILLDVMMPEMNGYEVCQRLKADEATKDIPVVFVTAMGQAEDETKGLEVGAVDYITKPISPPIVKARVKTHLALKKKHQELQQAYDIIEAQKKRMQEELDVGHEIQMSMLPLTFPAFPERDDIDIYAMLKPAREVGGDFYDFYFVDKECLCFCIGDVSGKGVPAALFMAVSQTLIKSRAAEDRSTASILTYVNDELAHDNETCMFVTVILGIINTKTGELVYTNAGHNPPYLKSIGGALHPLSERHGPIVGAVDGVVYQEKRVSLAPGDMLLLYTDGVTEAMDADEKLLGEDRLEKLLASGNLDAAEKAVEATVNMVQAYEEGTEQSDDITVLALKFSGKPEGATMAEHTIIIRNDLSEIDTVNEQFEAFASDNGLPMPIVLRFNMVFDELLNNIVSYAYRDEDEHQIEVKLELVDNLLSVTVADDGVPFNPLALETPDTEASLEDRDIGGLGIHLVKNVTDDISYHRRIDKNVLTLIKNLEFNKDD